jgi:Tfp pilus assembly protein PilE
MLVLAIASLLLVMAIPSWRHVQTEAVIDAAQLTLDRLVIRQLRFFQRHQRYAEASELPVLQALAPEIAAQYRLTVMTQGSVAYRLELLPLDPMTLPALSLDHTGRRSRTDAVSDARVD